MSLKQAYQLTIIDGLVAAKLNPNHELMVLARKIDWDLLADKLRPFYSAIGRHGKPVRLMVGAQILKHKYNLSDEALVERLLGDLYLRSFCGIDGSIHDADWGKPLDSTTLCKFRRRIGKAGLDLIESVLRDQLLSEGRISSRSQIVDSTVMEKHIRYPTDTRLLNEGRRRIVRHLQKLVKNGCSIKVGRTFARVSRKAIVMYGKLGRAGGRERLELLAKELLGYAKSVVRSATRAIAKTSRKRKCSIERIRKELKRDAELLYKVINQTEQRQQGIHVSDKIYSFAEPHVKAITKGKLGPKRYEFGVTVTLSSDRNGFIVSHQEYDRNINDVDTLEAAVKAWEQATRRVPKELAGDRGYSTTKHSRVVRSIERLAIPALGSRKNPDEKTAWFRRLRRARAHIEPIIGHLKADCRMNRSRYRGFDGDQLNAGWSVIAWNCHKWAKAA